MHELEVHEHGIGEVDRQAPSDLVIVVLSPSIIFPLQCHSWAPNGVSHH